MKSKRIISGLLALSLVFGGAVVPSAVVGNSIVAVASSWHYSDNYAYEILNDGTIKINSYFKFGNSVSIPVGSDNNPVDVVFPSEIDGYKVTQIGSWVIHCPQSANIEKITIPDGVTKIGSYAFSHAEYVKSIELPDSIITIDHDAFPFCKVLEKINLPKRISQISDYMFYGCKNLKSISIPEGVTTIGDHAFTDCTSLTSVTIPEGVTTIKSYAFLCCTGLTSIYIPDSVTDIGYNAFYDYQYDNEKKYEEKKPLEKLTIYCSANSYAEEYAKANGLKYCLLDQGFVYKQLDDNTIEIMKYVGNDTEVKIPSKIDNIPVTSIHSAAFYGSNTIKSVVIPDSVVSLGDAVFGGCTNLENVSLSNNVRSIGQVVFSGCSSLKEIVIPDSVTSIDSAAFLDCIGLEKVYLSNNLETIGASAFNGCKSLKEIVIPDSVISIESAAFVNCTGLESVTIPKNVVSIGKYAFAVCDNLTIYCYTNSAAQQYAIDNEIKYERIDAPKPFVPTYPTNIKVEYNEQYHQVRFTWDKVENAEKYGIAVYLAGKWRIQTQNITGTIYTTPKNLTPGKTYKVAIAAKVNGQWDVNNAIKNAVTVTVK